MPKCSASNCTNRGIHLFPKNSARRKQWESALRIKNFKASHTARLCAAHFKEEDYFGKSHYTVYEPLIKFLKKSAVPSIFGFTEEKPENPAALERQHCLEKRSQRKSFQDEPQPSTSVVVSQYELASQPSTRQTVSHYELDSDMIPEIACEETINTSTYGIPTQCSYSMTEFLSKHTQVDHEHIDTKKITKR